MYVLFAVVCRSMNYNELGLGSSHLNEREKGKFLENIKHDILNKKVVKPKINKQDSSFTLACVSFTSGQPNIFLSVFFCTLSKRLLLLL